MYFFVILFFYLLINYLIIFFPFLSKFILLGMVNLFRAPHKPIRKSATPKQSLNGTFTTPSLPSEETDSDIDSIVMKNIGVDAEVKEIGILLEKKSKIVVPEKVTDSWLKNVPIIDGYIGIRYSEERLEAVIDSFQRKIESNEIVDEYKLLRNTKLSDSCVEGTRIENKPKNRYRNVIPCKEMLLNAFISHIYHLSFFPPFLALFFLPLRCILSLYFLFFLTLLSIPHVFYSCSLFYPFSNFNR